MPTMANKHNKLKQTVISPVKEMTAGYQDGSTGEKTELNGHKGHKGDQEDNNKSLGKEIVKGKGGKGAKRKGRLTKEGIRQPGKVREISDNHDPMEIDGIKDQEKETGKMEGGGINTDSAGE